MIYINKEKLRKIVLFNIDHKDEINEHLDIFYKKNALKFGESINDLYLLAKTTIASDGNYLISMPLKSQNIGAIYRKIGKKKYIILNSAKKAVDNRFALSHELYHYYFPDEVLNNSNIEFYLFTYGDKEDDLKANAFAGNLLMPEEAFVNWQIRISKMLDEIYSSNQQFDSEPDQAYVVNAVTRIVVMMLTFGTTFMSVLIRLCELSFLDYRDDRIEKIMQYNNDEQIKSTIDMINGTTGIDMSMLMECTYTNEIKIIESRISDKIRKLVDSEIMDPDSAEYNLKVLNDMIENTSAKMDGTGARNEY